MKTLIAISVALFILSAPLSAANGEKAPCTKTLEEVQRMIKEKGLSWTAGETSVSGLSPAEKQHRLGLLPEEADSSPAALDPGPAFDGDDFPEVFDWREYGGVTPARDQGACGSCWAFAAMGAWEAYLAIYDGAAYDLSEQQVLSCNNQGDGCNGGRCSTGYKVFENPGSVSEENMPYMANDGIPCTQDQYDKIAVLDAHTSVGHSEEQIKTALILGPIAAGIKVYDDFFYYTGGCYDAAWSIWTDHAILILGWDDTMCDGEGAWICKNSWGKGWGMDGFFYIKFGASGIGMGSSRPIYYATAPANLVTREETMDDSSAGNGNGRIDEGETVEYWGKYLNTGEDATGIMLHFDTETAGIDILNQQSTLGDMDHLQQKNNESEPFSFAVADTFTGRHVQFTIDITANEGYVGRKEITLLVGRPDLLLVDDDDGRQVEDWYTDDMLELTAEPYEVWERNEFEGNITGDELSLYANIIWITGESTSPMDADTAAVKEYLDNGGKLFLSGQNIGDRFGGTAFFENYLRAEHLEDSNGIYVLEGVAGDLLGDGLFMVTTGPGGANNCSSPSSVNPLNGAISSIDYYSTETSAAIRYSGDYSLVYFCSSFEAIAAPADRRLLFRRIMDFQGIPTGIDMPDGGGDGGEWGAPASSAAALTISPNPFNPVTALGFSVPADNPRGVMVELSIYDILGRRVSVLVDERKLPGDYSVTWNGTDETSRSVASGLYFARLVVDGAAKTGKLVLLK